MKRYLGTRRGWLSLLVVGALAMALAIPATSFADNASGCDFAATGTTESCSGPLSGSTFAGGDGNLLTSPTTFGTTDWQNVSGLHKGIDLASGTGDNAFGQGTKEDDANVTTVSGSIPPNKSDLSRFYEASEFANHSNYLYLAWERTNVLGSANMDFEINQATTPNLGVAGPHTINRTAGDLLVTFDFTNGGGRPTLGLLFWVTSGSTDQCFSSNSLPCWGNRLVLNSTNSIGAVNNLDAVTDPIAPDAPRSLSALTFGEAAINLTAAGVFPAGTCEAFGSAFLKSRASASFPAEVKDFIAPIPVNISNCGEIKIIKHTDPRGLNQIFSYTSTIPNPSGTVTTSSTPYCQLDTSPSSFTLNDNGNTTADNSANTEDCKNVPANSYTVTEGSEPLGFSLESLICTATGGGSGAQDATNPFQANITVVPGSVVTCTYTNQQQLGAIKITKTGKDKSCTAAGGTCQAVGVRLLSGATFSITKGGTPISGSPFTTTNGVVCVDNLAFGNYVVTETAAPPGYKIDTTAGQTVNVDNNAQCSDSPYVGEAKAFGDTPLSQIRVTFHSKAGVGVTTATIQCTGDASASNLPDGSTGRLLDNLAPGTYACTVEIDP